jgi:hypothetical protein
MSASPAGRWGQDGAFEISRDSHAESHRSLRPMNQDVVLSDEPGGSGREIIG